MSRIENFVWGVIEWAQWHLERNQELKKILLMYFLMGVGVIVGLIWGYNIWGL